MNATLIAFYYIDKYAIETEDRELLKWYLKSLFARELFGEKAFYRIYQEKDNVIQKVIDLEHQSQIAE